uniref:VQ domain-containing protein n=1 Tax=Oryza brachyantha TaxID=4533 RepID=J3N233_ORYBR
MACARHAYGSGRLCPGCWRAAAAVREVGATFLRPKTRPKLLLSAPSSFLLSPVGAPPAPRPAAPSLADEARRRPTPPPSRLLPTLSPTNPAAAASSTSSGAGPSQAHVHQMLAGQGQARREQLVGQQQQPPWAPVIIYDASPKIIHAKPNKFMALVQHLRISNG